MTLRQRLLEEREAIGQAWLASALATYPGNSAAVFAREKDPFANPVGHSLRVGMQAILDALLQGKNVSDVREQLQDIMKIRAVQQFTPSQAVEFVFRLKGVLRARLGEMAADPECVSELTELDTEIDRIALESFDIFVGCRERVYELRINEVKRQVSWVADRVNDQGPGQELVNISPHRNR